MCGQKRLYFPLPTPLVTLYGKLIIFNAFYSVHRPVFSLKVKVAYENRKLAEKMKEKEKLVWETAKCFYSLLS